MAHGIGGYLNTASGLAASIGGGTLNQALSWCSTVVGGDSNSASNQYSTVTGGSTNQASGLFSTTIGGYQNTARGAGSVALGIHTLAAEDKSFVFGGHDDLEQCESAGANTAKFCAVELYVNDVAIVDELTSLRAAVTTLQVGSIRVYFFITHCKRHVPFVGGESPLISNVFNQVFAGCRTYLSPVCVTAICLSVGYC